MKIALCSSFVPFILGGGRNIVDWLQQKLVEAGHRVETIYLPQFETMDLICEQMMAYRWLDLTQSADRMICFRPQSHIIPHPNKVVWFIHHIRFLYELWDSPYRGVLDTTKNRSIRNAVRKLDTMALTEAKHLFTNSQVVADRVAKFNGLASEVLYPPLLDETIFDCKEFNDEIIYMARIAPHKRPHLLIEALAYTKSPVKLRLCGKSAHEFYTCQLNRLIESKNLADRVFFDDRWISELEKADILSRGLALAYLPFDEDSYGYPSLEASCSSKPIITTSDSGGVLELVEHDINGYVVAPTPQALAEVMDKLYLDKKEARRMGHNAKSKLVELNISWPHVLERLLS